MSYETLTYEVVEAHNEIELRKYPDFYIAEVTYPNGFNELFYFISGNNLKNEKISMTTPVFTSNTDGAEKTSFTLPKNFNSENLPTPKNPAIEIKKIESGYFLCITFKGMWTNQVFEKKLKELVESVLPHKYTILDGPYIARYNSPFSIPTMRRNEIMFRVDCKTCA